VFDAAGKPLTPLTQSGHRRAQPVVNGLS
jgi:hypothetical protein